MPNNFYDVTHIRMYSNVLCTYVCIYLYRVCHLMYLRLLKFKILEACLQMQDLPWSLLYVLLGERPLYIMTTPACVEMYYMFHYEPTGC